MAGSSIGILALQGAVSPHEEKLRSLKANPIQVRNPSALNEIRGIILPGGESTTMIHLLKLNGMWEPLKEFASRRPTWGICAGAILMAKRVASPHQESLNLLDIEVERNAYGRQRESFIDQLTPAKNWGETLFEGVFIRAPKIQDIRGKTKALMYRGNEVVMVEEDNLIACTFHPELTESNSIHDYFLRKCEA